MFGTVRLVLGKHVGLHPGTSYTLMNCMSLVCMTDLGWEFGFFPMEQIDFPSVVAASSLPAVAWWLEYGRGARGVKVIR